MICEIGFGKTVQAVNVPEENIIDVLLPNKVKTDCTGEKEVQRALQNPIGSEQLEHLVKGKKNIVIITSDITRPMPSSIVLPILLDKLYQAGIIPENIKIVFALGSHRHQTQEEMERLAGKSVFEAVTCVDSGENGFVLMGTTKGGTPVEISKEVAEADFRICLGNIEYHYFAGYSGGAKAIMPGVSTRSAIQSNHRRMVEASAVAGKLEGNPVREDIEEAIKMCPIDFLLNVVLDEHKQIVRAVAGDYILAHREGCKFLDSLYGKHIKELADIVIVSQGGAPKDLNLYQTQKALDNAKHAVKDGGIIILVGSCKEGMGEATFEKWMTEADSPDWLIDKVQKDFKLGGHKAAAIALVLKKSDIYLVSDMEASFVESIFMKPFSDVQAAFDAAFCKLGKSSRVLIMPYGGSTLPLYSK